MDYYLIDEVWRAMLGSNMIPAILFFIFLLLVPESPRWLFAKNRPTEALKTLTRINGLEKAREEATAITESVSKKEGSLRELFSPRYRLALIIGIVLPFLSQLAGITTVMYYAPAIFEKAGFQTDSAMGTAAIIGFFNMIFTVVAIWKIDVWGRKPLLIAGFSGLSISLLLIGYFFMSNQSAYLLVASFIVYIAVFAASLGPGVWVVIAEIFPTAVRGRAMSIATLSLFFGSTFVTQTYPVLREAIGIGPTFMIYGLIMIPSVIFVAKCIPETKGKTLEEIEQTWEESEPVKPVHLNS